jgi:hypothetical protein
MIMILAEIEETGRRISEGLGISSCRLDDFATTSPQSMASVDPRGVVRRTKFTVSKKPRKQRYNSKSKQNTATDITGKPGVIAETLRHG